MGDYIDIRRHNATGGLDFKSERGEPLPFRVVSTKDGFVTFRIQRTDLEKA